MKLLLMSADARTQGPDEELVPVNLGDQALTERLQDWLSQRGHDVRRLIGGSVGSSALTVLNVHRSSRWADAVIIGGGTLLADDQPDRTFAGHPRTLAVVISVARLHRSPVALLGVGASAVVRHRARLALQGSVRMATAVAVRDRESAEAVRALNRRDAHIGADVFLLGGSSSQTSVRRTGLTVAMNGDHGAPPDQFADVVARAVSSRDCRVSLLCMDQTSRDVGYAQRLEVELRKRGVPSVLAPVTSHWSHAARLIRSSEVLVTSRMHALYMAAESGTPCIAVGSSAKVAAFCRAYGVERVTETSQLDLQVGKAVDPGLLSLGRGHAEEAAAWTLAQLGSAR